MKLHVLPGDAQLEDFRKTRIDGDVVICREAFVDGDVRAADLEELWTVRANYLHRTYPQTDMDYRGLVVSEFEKLFGLPAAADVNLWFEYELFCHVNLWFCVWLLRESKATLYRVAPIAQRKDRTWKGFAGLTPEDLELCYEERIKFEAGDVRLGADLWTAFRERDHARLRHLSKTASACYPYLEEACEAEIEKEFTPKRILKELRDEGINDFPEMFAEFGDRAGVYGFGDLQVKRMLAEI